MAEGRCPHCGGDRIEETSKSDDGHFQRDDTPPFRENPVLFLWNLVVLLLGLTIIGIPIAWVLYELRNPVFNLGHTQTYTEYSYWCVLCGHRWKWRSNEPWPYVFVRPDLIAAGNRRLYEDRVAHEMAENALHGPPPR